MIGGIISLTPATMPMLSGSPTQPGDMFAAVFAALAPVDAALPDSVRPMPESMVDEEQATATGSSVSAEELLALVAPSPAPAPLPAPMPILVPAYQAVTASRQTPKRDEAVPVRDQRVRAVAPDNRDDAGKRLLAVQPMPELNLAHGTPPPLAPLAPVAPGGLAAAAPAPPPPLPSPDTVMEAVFSPMREGSPAPARELSQHSTGRDPALPQISDVQIATPVTPAVQITPAPPGPMPVMAQHLAGQIAAALPRLRQSGGEAVLTLDPARLGRVTLSWNPGESGGAVLTVRAVEPATAALLNRLGEEITAMLRAEPAVAVGGTTDLRLDIGRAERVAEPRQAELTNPATPREFSGEAGLSRHQQRAPQHIADPRPQTFGSAAVNPDEPDDAALPRSGRAVAPARLA